MGYTEKKHIPVAKANIQRIGIVKSHASNSDPAKEFCPIPDEEYSPVQPDYSKYNNCLLSATIKVDNYLQKGVEKLEEIKDKVINLMIEGSFCDVGNKLLKLIKEMSGDDKQNLTLPYDGCRLHVLDSLAVEELLQTLVRNVQYFILNVIYNYYIIF